MEDYDKLKQQYDAMKKRARERFCAVSCSSRKFAADTLRKSLEDWLIIEKYTDLGPNGNRTVRSQIIRHKAALRRLKTNTKEQV